ncbi:MAG: CARDB domain-containing protein [Methanobacteriota archaeon]
MVLVTVACLIMLIFVASVSCAATTEGGTQPITPPPGSALNTSAGPDYSISTIVLPNQTSWIETGTTLTPNITIRNLGSDDMQAEAVEITAYLGAHNLIPKNNTISPMKKGENREVTLEFMIPGIIPSGEYALIISIDPERDQVGGNIRNNDVSVTRLLTIRTVIPKMRSGGCGCS